MANDNNETPDIHQIVRMRDYVYREGGRSYAGPKTSSADEGERLDESTANQIRGMIRRNNRIRGFAREQGIEDWAEAGRQYQEIKDRLDDAETESEKWRIRDEFSA